MKEIDKQALFHLAVSALEGARKYHETPNKPKDAKKDLPNAEKRA